MFPMSNFYFVRGNHDLKSGDPWSELSIKCLPEPVQMEKWEYRHHPLEKNDFPYLAGHIHPGYGIMELAKWYKSSMLLGKKG